MPPLRRCAASPPAARGGRPLWPGEAGSTAPLGWGHLGLLRSGFRGQHRGFTLLELMIVVAIIALATAGVSLSLRDSDSTQLEREALRLSALLEAGRAQSRTSGVPVLWRNTGSGFEFIGSVPAQNAPEGMTGPRTWLSPQTRVLITQPPGAVALVLGPDPLIAAQRLRLMQGERQLTLGTDGLSPFAVQPEDAAP